MGGEGSGRKPTSDTASKTQTNMAEAGLIGSGIIRDYLRGEDVKHRKVKPISMTKLKACIESVNHTLGLPKAKIELKTDAMTMKDIAELAVAFDNANGDAPGDDVMHVPTKPLTARQVKERAQENAEN